MKALANRIAVAFKNYEDLEPIMREVGEELFTLAYCYYQAQQANLGTDTLLISQDVMWGDNNCSILNQNGITKIKFTCKGEFHKEIISDLKENGWLVKGMKACKIQA